MPGGFLIFKDKEGRRKHMVWCGKADKRMSEVLSVVNEVNTRVKKDRPLARRVERCL